MNPQDALIRQVMMARLSGTPTPQISQMSPQSGMQVPAAPVPAQNPTPTGDKQMGMEERKSSTEDTLAKNILPGTAHQDPHIKTLSKVLLEKLIPYLGR